MKFTIVCALVAAVQTIVTPGDATDTKNNAAGAAPTPYVGGINPDVSKDAAYYNEIVGGPSHSTGNYTYSIKPNEYTSWNGISYTHNYDSTGTHGGANRIPVHDYPVYDNGAEKQQQTIDAHPKTEYGEHRHSAAPLTNDNYPTWQ